MTRPPANDATWAGKKTSRSGPGPRWKSSERQAFVSRNCWRSVTTVSCSTAYPPPANSSRCCRSPRPRPTPNDSCSSAPNWQRCCPPSSAASAPTPAQYRPSAPTTGPNAFGWLRPHGCSSAESAPSTAESVTAPSATCSTPLSPTPASPIPPAGAHCTTPRTISEESSSRTRSCPDCHRISLRSSPGTGTSTSPSATKRSTPTKRSSPTWRFWAAGAPSDPPRSTGRPPTRNGKNSSVTSNAAKSPPAPAAARSPPPASTNTPAYLNLAICSSMSDLRVNVARWCGRRGRRMWACRVGSWWPVGGGCRRSG